MKNKLILVVLLILLGCDKRPSDVVNNDLHHSVTPTEKAQTDLLTAGQINYEKSLIHRDFDNDSLLLDIPELKRLVNSFTSKSKIKEKEYGAGDYFGKYRVYADKGDTLVIDKGDGGDYGFGSSIYVKRMDSIILYRNYEFNWLASDSGQIDEITEELVTFTNGTMIFKQRKMKTKDWSQLKFSTDFVLVTEDPSKKYKTITNALMDLYKRDLVE